MIYTVGSFYKFCPVQYPDRLKGILSIKCSQIDLVGSIIVAPEGINGTVAGDKQNIVEVVRISKNFSRVC